MVPEPVLRRDVGDRVDRVDRAGAGRADRARDDRGMQAVGAVALDRGAQRGGVERVARRRCRQLRTSREAGDARAARDRRVRLRRSSRRRTCAAARSRATTWTRCVASDALIWIDAAARPAARAESAAGARAGARASRRRAARSPCSAGLVAHSIPCTPSPAATSSPRIDGGRRVGREVREPARRLPVRDARQDDLVEVAQQRLERLGLLRRALGQPRGDLAGLHRGRRSAARRRAPCSPRPSRRPRGRGGGTRRASMWKRHARTLVLDKGDGKRISTRVPREPLGQAGGLGVERGAGLGADVLEQLQLDLGAVGLAPAADDAAVDPRGRPGVAGGVEQLRAVRRRGTSRARTSPSSSGRAAAAARPTARRARRARRRRAGRSRSRRRPRRGRRARRGRGRASSRATT